MLPPSRPGFVQPCEREREREILLVSKCGRQFFVPHKDRARSNEHFSLLISFFVREMESDIMTVFFSHTTTTYYEEAESEATFVFLRARMKRHKK